MNAKMVVSVMFHGRPSLSREFQNPAAAKTYFDLLKSSNDAYYISMHEKRVTLLGAKKIEAVIRTDRKQHEWKQCR